VVEEGIAAMVFGYAARRDFLRSHTSVEHCLLERIAETTAPFDVAAATAADWEQVILLGFRLWRQLRSHGGNGVIHADRCYRRMVFCPAQPRPAVTGPTRAAHLTLNPDRTSGAAQRISHHAVRLAG
jgi:hypothetical protein